MRYRDTGDYQNPGDYQNSGVPVDDDLDFYSILLGIISGVGFVYFGLRVKRYWLVIWGVGLVLASLSYFVMRSMGYY